MDRLTADIALRAHETLRKAERMIGAVDRRIRKLGPLVGSRYAALRRDLVTYVQRGLVLLQAPHRPDQVADVQSARGADARHQAA